MARQLIELGYRGTGETLKREEFNARKKAEREKHVHKQTAPKQLASAGKDLVGYPLLQALANREELVRNGKLTVRGSKAARGGLHVTPARAQSIIFIRDKNSKGQEVSGYIDFAHRSVQPRSRVGRFPHPPLRCSLKTEDFEPYFARTKRLLPRPADLSYFNWETQRSTSNSSPNFQVRALRRRAPAARLTGGEVSDAGDRGQRGGPALQEQAGPQGHQRRPKGRPRRQQHEDPDPHDGVNAGRHIRPHDQEEELTSNK